MEQILNYLQDSVSENILQFILIFLIFYMLLKLIKLSLVKKINTIANQTKTEIDDLLRDIVNSYGPLFYLFIPLYLTAIVTNISDKIDQYLIKFSIIFFTYYIVKSLNIIVDFGFKKLLATQKINQKKDPTLLKILNSLSQIVLWFIAVLVILQNFHYNVSTLVGGLGITGIAVAFGLQNVLKDVFSFMSIYVDKPFNVGDSIELDGTFASVKQIGIRSTRLKTLTGDELIIPNQDITQSRIRNFRKLKKRRIELQTQVAYNTPETKLKKIPEIMESILSPIELVEFKRCHLKRLGDSAILFETVYYLDSSSFNKYMDVRQEINLGLIREFKKYKISIPFPTQEIYIKK